MFSNIYKRVLGYFLSSRVNNTSFLYNYFHMLEILKFQYRNWEKRHSLFCIETTTVLSRKSDMTCELYVRNINEYYLNIAGLLSMCFKTIARV